MKKLLTLLLAMLMVFALAACDLGNTEDPGKDNPGVSQSGENNDGGDKLNTKREEAVKQANKDNWQQVVKDNFGVTVTVPDGWTVDIAKYAAGGVKVTFECSSTETEALAFLDGLYAQLKAQAVDGVKSDYDGTVYESYSEALEKAPAFTVGRFDLVVDADKELGYSINFGFDEGSGDSVTGVDIFFELDGEWVQHSFGAAVS